MKFQRINYIGAFLCILIAVCFFIWASFKICSAYIEFKKQPRGIPRFPSVPLVIETPIWSVCNRMTDKEIIDAIYLLQEPSKRPCLS